MTDDLDRLLHAVADVTAAWELWRATHGVTEARFRCCERSTRLFARLDALHALVIEGRPGATDGGGG